MQFNLRSIVHAWRYIFDCMELSKSVFFLFILKNRSLIYCSIDFISQMELIRMRNHLTSSPFSFISCAHLSNFLIGPNHHHFIIVRTVRSTNAPDSIICFFLSYPKVRSRLVFSSKLHRHGKTGGFAFPLRSSLVWCVFSFLFSYFFGEEIRY